MKKLTTTVALIIFIFSFSGQAQSPSGKETIEQLVTTLAEAYTSKSLGKLDEGQARAGKVKIVVEHSLGEDGEQYESKVIKTFEQGERWLKSREREEGAPFREARPLLRCRKGVCTFNFDGGILHNHLYLQKLTYGYRNGRPYIKTIYLLDGD